MGNEYLPQRIVGKLRFAHKVGNTQAVHDAVDGSEQHGADAGQHEPQQAGIGKVHPFRKQRTVILKKQI